MSQIETTKNKRGLAGPFKFKVLNLNLVSIVIWFERTHLIHSQILGLLVRKLCQLHAELVEVKSRDFFVEVFWQTIDIDLLVLVAVRIKLDLRQNLIRE